MYDSFAGQAAFHKLLEKEIVARSSWIGIDVNKHDLRVLDYACGTGVVSQVFAPYSQQILGVDLSQEMVDVYNSKAKVLGIADKMRAVVADFITGPDDDAGDVGSPDNKDDGSFRGFDIAVVGVSLHHYSPRQLYHCELAQVDADIGLIISLASTTLAI